MVPGHTEVASGSPTASTILPAPCPRIAGGLSGKPMDIVKIAVADPAGDGPNQDLARGGAVYRPLRS